MVNVGIAWADTGEEGLAFSICLAATDRPEQSHLDLARALSEALGFLLPGRIVVKPPNDLMVDGRKLAGVLIEQAEGLAVIGIGINVGQRSWPEESGAGMPSASPRREWWLIASWCLKQSCQRWSRPGGAIESHQPLSGPEPLHWSVA